jgi:hypothetical protein
MTKRCSHCGQLMREQRAGIFLSPLKAAILDRIKAAGELGVSTDEIIADCYAGRRPVEVHTIKAHVWQINSLLASTEWAIRSDRRLWRLVREYDAQDDVTKSFDVAYGAIRERKAAGGKGWEPK